MKGELTEKQKSFLYRAAELGRLDMAIIPRGFQHKSARRLEALGLLTYAGFAAHEETGVEQPSWRITEKGKEEASR